MRQNIKDTGNMRKWKKKRRTKKQ